MAKLVVLSAGLNGRTHELNVDKTTIGRVDDNTFQIADPSVSSHHCEVLLRGSDVFIKDLNSTNGSFINGEKIGESVLNPGQTLRLGQIELQLLTEGMPIPAAKPAPSPTPSAPAPAGSPAAPSAPAPAPAGQSRKLDSTMVVPRGVNLNELSEGARPPGFDTTSKGFSKKVNNTNKMFLIVGAIVFAVICAVVLFVLMQLKH
jgi:pSer/pThr/pTyr-binding forkhead associated (FHA) protein